VHGAIRETRGTLPDDAGVRVIVDAEALSRANVLAALNVIEKALASHS
jgi:hypothetical protein